MSYVKIVDAILALLKCIPSLLDSVRGLSLPGRWRCRSLRCRVAGAMIGSVVVLCALVSFRVEQNERK